MTLLLRFTVFLSGLAVVGWVGAGYVGANLLALAVTALIAAVYLAGVAELRRFGHATQALAAELAGLRAAPPALQPWLDRLPAPLRDAVRRRVEGASTGLPGPALAPYLAGLLVLLGMLGTFVGMVLTLRGTGLALEHATDLNAVRGSLVAPVQGLGLAFGTSVAGVAASAALGLLTTLARRERAAAVQALDAAVAGPLRAFSPVQQRETSLALMQRQAEALPALVERVQVLMEAMARRAESADARLVASQEDFHAKAEASYAGLAASVDRSLKASLQESARIAGATITPVAEATLAAVARETAALQAALAAAALAQSDALAARLEANGERVAQAWTQAQATHERQVEALSTRLEADGTRAVAGWQAALAGHEAASRALSDDLRATLGGVVQAFERQAGALVEGVGARQAAWQAELAAGQAAQARESAALQARVAESTTQQLDALAGRLDAGTQRVAETLDAVARQVGEGLAHSAQGVADGLAGTARRLGDEWQSSATRQETASARVAAETRSALADAAGAIERHSAALLQTVAAAHAQLQQGADARERERLGATTGAVASLAATLRDEWRAAGAQALVQQQAMGDAMARTAGEIAAQAEGHATATLAEIERLVQAASEAPRAAAEVIAELRDKLSDSMARDNALLDERTRILDTLGQLLATITQAATEQRSAVDALVGASADMLARVGERFGAQVDAHAGRLSDAAAHVGAGAVEVASLGEAFTGAVQQFGQSNDKLVAQLQRIDAALGKSLVRSDEQLAYYVAQAREVVDLSVLSQKQIMEDLQRLAGRADAVGAAS